MQKKCVLCLKDYFREIYQDDGIYIEAGELLDLDAGKIYNDATYWICDLYSDKGIEHFVLVDNYKKESIIEDFILELQQGGINEIHVDAFEKLFDYSIQEDGYRNMSEDTLIEGMESVVNLLKSENSTPCMDKVDLLLDSLWCAMILLDREVKGD